MNDRHDPNPYPAHTWPTVDADEFVVTVDDSYDADAPMRPWLVFRVGDQVLFREPTGYGNGGHIIEVCRSMRDSYAGRVRDFVVTEGARKVAEFEDPGADGKLRKAFRPLRKDYMRRKAEEGNAPA